MLALMVVVLSAAPEQCAEAFSATSVAIKKGQLLSARAALRTCASDACPAAMRPLCIEDLRQLELRIPSVVLGARDRDGRDVSSVRTSLDGERLADSLDGRALELDPGPHTFVFEAPGAAPVKLDVLVREGEKARALTAALSPLEAVVAAPAKPAEPSPPVATAPVAVTASTGSSSLGAGFWVGTAVVVVGAVAWAAFGASGLQGRSSLESCRGHCDDASVGRVSALFIGADVGMVVTAVGALVAAISLAVR